MAARPDRDGGNVRAAARSILRASAPTKRLSRQRTAPARARQCASPDAPLCSWSGAEGWPGPRNVSVRPRGPRGRRICSSMTGHSKLVLCVSITNDRCLSHRSSSLIVRHTGSDELRSDELRSDGLRSDELRGDLPRSNELCSDGRRKALTTVVTAALVTAQLVTPFNEDFPFPPSSFRLPSWR